jgi:cellulose synthase/poly-beta-1,6-N-acetylglucosamine synthase-like glycosyltransferase
MQPTFDIIIPCYQETDTALRATIEACQRQTLEPQAIYIVDDGSPTPFNFRLSLTHAACSSLRQESNQGISSAGTLLLHALRQTTCHFSTARYCLAPLGLRPWLLLWRFTPTCAACGRLVPSVRRFLLTAWRLRFQENIEERGGETGEITFATVMPC